MRLGGRVVLRAKVGSDGTVVAVSVHRSSGVKSLDDSAARALRRWRFEPARRFSVAIEMEVAVPIVFRLE